MGIIGRPPDCQQAMILCAAHGLGSGHHPGVALACDDRLGKQLAHPCRMKPEPDAGHVLSFPRRGGQDLARLLWEDRGPDHIRVMTSENNLGRAKPNTKHIAPGVAEFLPSPHVLWPARPLVALWLLAEVERGPIPLVRSTPGDKTSTADTRKMAGDWTPMSEISWHCLSGRGTDFLALGHNSSCS